ncbi:MAG: primosomal protein N', partial [Clostridia bacterium]|nr:primosomal protein N' [Clostridia bacterium]
VKTSENPNSLIFGVTGSGKTEVYLSLIEDCLDKGRNAIMLVPEIALTPQTFRQLRARFGNLVAILHSGLSAGERFDEWWRLRNGEAKIAVGARSAIFAPLENVGLIVIDEEHDGSYLSESAPRYSTIKVAKFRAEQNNAKLVVGSATPSVETYLKAKTGEFNLIEMPERINKKPMPSVEIADMRGEIRRGNNTPFSSALKQELEDCLRKGNQAIIFLNQRGYSRSVICTACGHVVKCDSCDVSLTYHKEEDALLCHYCGAKYKMISACTECGSTFLRFGGTGTERIVYELNKLFPSARILRMDRDTTKNKEGHLKILSDFSDKKADILVGTQMIAKGHDFPSVTVVGILDADMSLYFSDFRSGERTFQLITQVAGRCGRGEEKGKVIMQTYSPENPVLKKAISYDYKGFFEHEISVRKATAFPPFTDIVRVLVSGENEQETVNATKNLYNEIKEIYEKDRDKFRFFGCMKAPIKRLQNKFRYQILMRITADSKDIFDKINSLCEKYNSRKIITCIEINSNNL